VSPELIGLCGFIVLFILLASGIPIGVGMGVVGFVGLCLTLSVPAAMTKMAIAPFELVSNYTFASLPLFLLMGHAILSSGQGAAMFETSRKWFGRMPGGLAMATIVASAGFGAVCASALATSITMGLVAMPEMKKRNYDSALLAGTIAVGGAAGGLIPPSNFLLIYGIMTENSIAKLFIAGIIPGTIVAVSYLLVITLRCWRNPKLGPPAGRHSMREKIACLKDIWELVALVIFTLGGLVIGIFTSTEAGAVGAAGAFLSAAVRRKLTWKSFSEAVLETMKTTGMVYAILIGAVIFNFFCAASGLPTALSEWVAGLKVTPFAIMTVIVIIYLILGALMDEVSIQLLTIPVFYPLVVGLGFDPIWFGCIQCRLLEIGMIAPPVGISVFVVSGLDKSIPMAKIFKGVLWFLVADIITMAMFMYWPEIITCLPNLVK